MLSINAYPVPQPFIETAAAKRGLDLGADFTSEAVMSDEYRLVYADIMLWLSEAPNISQGGQSYSFNDDQRLKFRNKALAIYGELGKDSSEQKAIYGYKGSRL